MSQQLRVPISLGNTCSLIPSTKFRWITIVCDDSSRQSDVSGPQGHLHQCAETLTPTERHAVIIIISFKRKQWTDYEYTFVLFTVNF